MFYIFKNRYNLKRLLFLLKRIPTFQFLHIIFYKLTLEYYFILQVYQLFLFIFIQQKLINFIEDIYFIIYYIYNLLYL